MQIMLIHNIAGGFGDYVDVPEGTTLRQLFSREASKAGGSSDPTRYVIRVNHREHSLDEVLQPNDRVSITPTKIAGAC